MEIINITTVEAGWNIPTCIISGTLAIMGIVLLILMIRAWPQLNKEEIFWCIFSIILALSIGIGLPLKYGREPVAYNKYDVLFTEPIDMNEFDAKYTITGKDGNIWHIEDKH
ncbi:MAG: hypothetical protein II453_00350 [Alphaproteobacteria bacterium]|nr:hypothetical protein [Alphaproteobacteria bacterium]